MAVQVLIVDDHAVVRQGLRMFLKADHDLRVVGEAADGAQALRLAHELKPDVVLMDLLMPVMDGVHATEAIRRELPDTEVLALTSVLERASITSAIRAGAIGYLLKDTQAADLRRAIKAAAAHQVQLSPAVAAQLMRDIRVPGQPEALTERETDVLRLIASGQTNKAIAHSLNVGEETVKSHVSKILAKLGVTSRTQAALCAMRIGLVSRED
jgi:DNA-binding NarL/FixJ family response regulator